MKKFLQNASSIFSFFRNTFFIGMFLLTGNYHQAVEKNVSNKAADADLSFLEATITTVNSEYSDYIVTKTDSLLKRLRFNGSVLIAHNGHEVYNKSFGFSKLTAKTNLTPENNIFQLASAGKQFTAVATLILFERGLINLDDPVCQHIKGFPYTEVTIRHLLKHTSGLQNYFYLVENFWKKPELPLHQDMLDIFISRKVPLNFSPGRRFTYSNTGYAFLAMLVEKVSGQPFYDFVATNIFQPLEMNHSFVFHPSMDLNQLATDMNLTVGHEPTRNGMREIGVEMLDGITGDKGIFSTTTDLLKWDNALENNLLISAQTRQMTFECGKLRSGHQIGYGFGYRIRHEQGQQIVYHHGWWRGYRTAYIRLPENTLLVILNNTTASVSTVEEHLRKIIAASPFEKFTEEKIIYSLSCITPEQSSN